MKKNHRNIIILISSVLVIAGILLIMVDVMNLPLWQFVEHASEMSSVEGELPDQSIPLADPQEEDEELKEEQSAQEEAEEKDEDKQEDQTANKKEEEEVKEEKSEETSEETQEEKSEVTPEKTQEETSEETQAKTPEVTSEEPGEKKDTESEPAEAGTEDRSVWEKTLPEHLPKGLKEAIVAVARSQAGYQADNQSGKKPWSRYGAFMGDPYADPWDAEFVLFTLHYAGVLDVLADHPKAPVKEDTEKWISELREKDMLISANDYLPNSGDIVFLKAESLSGGDSVRAFVVTESGEAVIQTIGQGIGNSSDRVMEEKYSLDEVLFCAVPVSGDGFALAADVLQETKDEDQEDQPSEKTDQNLKEQTLKKGKVVLEGLMPEDATMTAKDVSGRKTVRALETEDETMVAAYDITIHNGETEFQPEEDHPIQVEISNAQIRENSDLTIWHILDDGTKEEIKDFAVQDGKVAFEATGFSVYVIVQGPEPTETAEEYAASLTDLTNPEAEDGFYLSVVRGGSDYYFRNTLNNNSAILETTDINAASVWYFEKSDAEGQYLLFTMVSGEKKYLKNTSNNLVGLENKGGTALTISMPADGLFEIKTANAKKWLQHSNSGSGIRFYTDNTNSTNCRIRMTFVSSLTVSDDPYALNGTSHGLMNYSGEASYGEALMATVKNEAALESSSMSVRVNPINRDQKLYVAEDSGITMWTFHAAEEDYYTLSAVADDGTKYLKAEGAALTLVSEENATKFRVIPGTGIYAGKIRLVSEGRAVSFENGNSYKTAQDSAASAKLYLNFVELSDLTEDDFVVYSASKVSVSDTETVTNGSRVILYTRSWNDDAKRYEFYAVDHDGSLVLCYESGDSIQWIGSKINTLLWSFTEYYEEGTGDPNYYYELKNPYSGKYIAPQISGGQILCEEPIGINLNGRRYGDYYSTIVAWDDPYYAYAGLKVENSKIVSCPYSEAEDFYFAIMQDAPAPGSLTEVPTVDHTQYGIKMKVADYTKKTKVGSIDTTVEQNSVLGDSTGGAVTYANTGLVSTDLKANGYPVAEKTGQSLENLFASGKEVNHLFVGSTYSGSGYYEFDSTQNFASLGKDGSFKVYKELGTTDLNNRNSLKHGQFFPFNDLDPSKLASINGDNLYSADLKPLSENDPRKYEQMYLVQKPEYYFGVEIEASFVQTPSGHDAWGHDIIYEFTGDDDFWLYVDGELVIDLGGIHSALPGSVNYCTGQVNVNGKKTTLKDIFEENYRGRGLSEEKISEKIDEIFTLNKYGQYVFTDYSSHTMKIFFMERGGGASNLHMRFNLYPVKSGQVLLHKQISGTDKKDYKLAEYAYQVEYQTVDDDGVTRWHRLNENTETGSHINVAYQNTNVPLKYMSSFTPAGGQTEYKDVYFLTPGQTAAISVPEDTLEYRIVECGVNTQVYDEVKANDAVISPQATSDEGRADFRTSAAKVSERQRVVFDNHVSDEARRTLTISKKLYDRENKLITNDTTGFSFRLYLGGENDSKIETADMQDYYVKDPKGNYCAWDARKQAFVSLGKKDYSDLTVQEKKEATFQTSFNGAISKIPAEYRVEVRDLLVGTQFKIEERASEIPAGYRLIGYVREGNSYITNDGQDNVGTIRENESPAIEIRNRRGFGLTAKKVWSDESFMESHGDIFFGIYVNGRLLEGSVKRLAHPSKTVYYYYDELEKNKGLSDYEIREVMLDGAYTIDHETNVAILGAGCRVTQLGEGETLRITAKAKADQKTDTYDYAVNYAKGSVKGQANNIRTDTITNSRHGIRLVKQDWSGHALAGASFDLTNASGSPVGAGSYTSDEDGLITIAYVNVGTEYTLTETKAPVKERERYSGPGAPVKFSLDTDGILKVTEDGGGCCETAAGAEDGMPSIIIKNRPLRLTAAVYDGSGAEESPALEGVHFALYREVSVDGITSMDFTPIAGMEDLITGKDGVIPSVNQMLEPGTYYLKEKAAPVGYDTMLGEAVRFTITPTRSVILTEEDARTAVGQTGAGNVELTVNEQDDGTMAYALIIQNAKKIPAPTGISQSQKPYLFIILLSLLLLMVFIFGWRRKRQSYEE